LSSPWGGGEERPGPLVDGAPELCMDVCTLQCELWASRLQGTLIFVGFDSSFTSSIEGWGITGRFCSGSSAPSVEDWVRSSSALLSESLSRCWQETQSSQASEPELLRMSRVGLGSEMSPGRFRQLSTCPGVGGEEAAVP
jgi:hypothetical protein